MFIRHKSQRFGLPLFLITIMILFQVLACPPAALAHKVYLFAWVEGDTVLVDAYFSKSKKVMGGKIEVMDSSGQKILEGLTDDNGRFSFKVPKKEDLYIYAEAGMGHKTEFVVKADELPDMGPATGAAEPRTEKPAQAQPEPAPDQSASHQGQTTSIDPEQLKKIVEEAVDIKIKPLIRSIASLQEEEGPGLVEIIGGIGWIFGLMGLVMYFRSRKGGKA